MPWIFDISVPITAGNSLWRYPGILEVKLAGVIEGECGGITLDFEGVPNVSPDRLGAVKDGKNVLTEVLSDAALMATPGSFWYSQARGFCRFNLARYSDGVAAEGFQSALGKVITFGIIKSFCDSVDYLRDDKSTYEGTFSDPRLKSVPNASAKMDSLDYGIQAFNDVSLQLIGVDGAFEGVDMTGAIVKGYYTEPGEEKSAAKKTAFGFVSKIQEGDETTITIGDIRWLLSKNAKCGTLTKAKFPHLSEDNAGKMIPIYWNKQTKIQPICLNANEDLSDSPTSKVNYCIGATPDAEHAIRRVDRVYTSSSDGSITIPSGFTFGAFYDVKIRRADGQRAVLDVLAGSTTLTEGADYTLEDAGEGYRKIKFTQTTALPANTTAIDVSAYSDDNDGKDIEADVQTWSATLIDQTTGLAYVSIPASIAYDDAPIDILVDLFGWANNRADEAEWLNGADIIRDALNLFAGYAYDSDFDIQSWEIERQKCLDAGLHLSPRIEDDTTINDLIGKVAKSSMILFTCRQDGLFDLKVDAKDIYPQWRIESYQRLEVGGESVDITSAFSTVTVNYGTAGDSEASVYLDSTYKDQLEIANFVEATKTIDTILADEQSAKAYAAMVYDRTFNLETYKPRARIEIKVPVEKYLLDIWPTKAFIAPRTRSGDLFAAYAVESVTRSESDNMITIVGRKRYDIGYDTEYTQGVLCDDFICDGQVIGATTIEAA